MYRFARTIIGYHGCLKPFANEVLDGTCEVNDWIESNHANEWLGRGIYFWEHAPERAMRWATAHAQSKGGEPGVIGAVINLGRCFDLTDIRFAEMLAGTYHSVREAFEAAGKPMPENRPQRNDPTDEDLKNRQLDCLIVNSMLGQLDDTPEAFQTVRSAFMEGGEAYPGAKFMKESHIQVAVRERSCILGVFRPILPQ